MELKDIRRLADNGLAAFPPGRLEEAAVWLREFGAATGDARYYALSDLLSDLKNPFDHGRGLPVEVTADVDAVFCRELPPILDSNDAAFASTLACQLHAEITRMVRGD